MSNGNGKHKLVGLAAARIAAGHSQDRLARLANVNIRVIQQAENRHPPTPNGPVSLDADPQVAQRIADALGVSVASLL